MPNPNLILGSKSSRHVRSFPSAFVTSPNQRFLVIAWIKINGLADKLIINRIGDFTEGDTGGGRVDGLCSLNVG